MAKFTGSLVQHPARISFTWYASLIAIGALLLKQPICRTSGHPAITLLDALFTSTSAACVTGLTVRSTGHDYSFIGQLVILILIQLGGIGIMTVTTFVTFRLGGRESLRHRAIIAETLGAGSDTDLRWVLSRVIQATLLIEGCGIVLLAIRFLFDHSWGEALWLAVFHSISAFCNAGFGLADDSLTRYQDDIFVNLTVILLIVTGGIGFPVMLDISRNWHGPWRQRWDRLLLHSKLMLIGTVALLTFGTVAFLALEQDGALQGVPRGTQVLIALFHSTSSRTAGFNTVEIGKLTNATLFITMLLMMIGAGPCSTGGGFKVSTFMVLVIRAWTTFRGYLRVHIFRRSIPRETVDRATATALLFTVVSILALTTLLVFEQSEDPHAQSQGLFMDAMFEVISALGTVGLSTGMTTHLSEFGRLIIIILMFIGRLGPISVFVALSSGAREMRFELAQEEPLIG